ncbi:MAG TPA: hypothetical protein VJJ82_00390 [Candidatus Nanoarchaeia archaeon]|nr:hypothetical protein [Candidatus Nanoarchaeia archaeon]
MLPFEKEFPQAEQNFATLNYFLLPDEAEFLRFAYKLQRPASTTEYYAVLLGLEIGRVEKKADTLLRVGNMQHFSELEKMARKVGAKASYKRASSTLERLEQWGFLKRRPVKHMKEKFFWVINPEFLQKYQHQLVHVFGS